MDEFISRKAAIAYIREQSEECQKAFEELGGESGIYADAYNDLAEDFYSIPAADVAPVVHGHWIEKQEETYCPVQYGEDGNPILHKYTRYICNLCGRRSVVPEPYCHCGAKMDGGDSDATD